MSVLSVGVDIAKLKFDVALYCDGKYKHRLFDNTPKGHALFLDWLSPWPGAPVCMEATGTYGEALATYLFDHGIRVSVVNPARVHAFANTELSRSKTDKGDAKLIASDALLHQPEAWQPTPKHLRALQALVRRLDDLLIMQGMEHNRQLTADATVQKSIQTLLDTLSTEIDTTRQSIKQQIKDDPGLKQQAALLISIPGIGPATTAALLALLGNVARFETKKHATSFVGLCPAERQSGQYRGQTRLSRTGDRLLRKALYLPAIVAWKHNPAIRAFCERLKAKGKNGKTIVCAAMRKLLCMAYGVLKSGMPYDLKKAFAHA